MANTISLLGTVQSIQPEVITDYAFTITSRNVVHEILNRAAPVITYGPASTRRGTLNILCPAYGDMLAALALHNAPGTLQWVSTDFPEATTLNYAVVGDVTFTQTEDKTTWLVAVGYREVAL